MHRRFRQVDVFSATPYLGNPLAVVLDAADLDTETMGRFARWTNLSETAFLLPPTDPAADYRVRIFTTSGEIAFAGHPTLGACHAWLEAGGVPRSTDVVVQECGVGLVPVHRTPDGLAFAAPPLLRSEPLAGAARAKIARQLRIPPARIVDACLLDNGLSWNVVLLGSAADVLAVRPGVIETDIGVVGPHPAGNHAAFEVRGFFVQAGSTVEDPATGSLNAVIAQWLLETGRASAPWIASQGVAIGRAARVRVTRSAGGTIWIGGAAVTCVSGAVEL